MNENTKGQMREQERKTPWTVVDGVRLYGTVAGEVSPHDIEIMETTPGSLLHIVRHLGSISGEVRERLCGLRLENEDRVVDDAFIDAQLESAGSKFNEKITDPKAIIEFSKRRISEALQKGKKLLWIRNEETGLEVAQLVLATESRKRELGLGPEDPLGTTRVIPVTPEIAGLVWREQRGRGEKHDQIIVNVIEGIPAPTTDRMIIYIKREAGSAPEFFSAFTGIPTPKLPRPGRQPPDELAYNEKWWSRHTFVR